MPLIRTRKSKGPKGTTRAMNRIPPSQKTRTKTEELLNRGLNGDADVNLPLDTGNTGVHEES
jgi:hypothetical protein